MASRHDWRGETAGPVLSRCRGSYISWSGLRFFPAGQAPPTVSSLNYAAGQTRGNNAVVAVDPSGAIAAFVGQAAGTTVDLIVDVNGYFE